MRFGWMLKENITLEISSEIHTQRWKAGEGNSERKKKNAIAQLRAELELFKICAVQHKVHYHNTDPGITKFLEDTCNGEILKYFHVERCGKQRGKQIDQKMRIKTKMASRIWRNLQEWRLYKAKATTWDCKKKRNNTKSIPFPKTKHVHVHEDFRKQKAE